MSARTPLARRVIAALLLVQLTACHTWQPTTVSPQGWTPEERPSCVRATPPPSFGGDRLLVRSTSGLGILLLGPGVCRQFPTRILRRRP